MAHSKSGLINTVLYGLPFLHCLTSPNPTGFSLPPKEITHIKSYPTVCFCGAHSKKVGNMSNIGGSAYIIQFFQICKS